MLSPLLSTAKLAKPFLRLSASTELRLSLNRDRRPILDCVDEMTS